MHNIIKRNKVYIYLVIIIVLISLLVGIIYFNMLNNNIKLDIINTLNNSKLNYNNIIKDLIIMCIILVTSFFIIGIPLSILYLIYNGLSLGFILSSFYSTYKINGIFYFLYYSFINKLIPFILIIIFIKRCIQISRLLIGYIIYKDNSVKRRIYYNFKNSLYIILFVLIINIIIYFISPVLLNY